MTNKTVKIFDRIVFGTVQIGLPYGRNHKGELCSEADAEAILEKAWEIGIRAFDTAESYGVSVQRLSRWLKKTNRMPEVSVVTKVNSNEIVGFSVLEKASGLFSDCFSLTILTHDQANPQAWEFLKAFGEKNSISVGQSLYTNKEIVIAKNDNPDLIQIPGNILDKRQIEAAKGISQRIDVRSIFLQGLLLDSETEAEIRVPGSGKIISKLKETAKRFGINLPHALILGVLLELDKESRIVLGADNPEEIQSWQGLEEMNLETLDCFIREINLGIQGHVPDYLLDPRCWPR